MHLYEFPMAINSKFYIQTQMTKYVIVSTCSLISYRFYVHMYIIVIVIDFIATLADFTQNKLMFYHQKTYKVQPTVNLLLFNVL